MCDCTIIGISDSPELELPREALREISSATVFSGGRRHHSLVSALLPRGARWIDITPPLDKVFEQYEGESHVVIFASGDPLFYGFAATVRHRLPDCKMRVFPSPNSLQTLAHRLCLPYGGMRTVSLTGREWDGLDEALISGDALIGCLTDREKTPGAIWQRMREYGYDNYQMYIGEHLGNKTLERVGTYTEGAQYDSPNCVILQRTHSRPRRFGIPDSEFALLDGRASMITKMPVRLATLAALDLGQCDTLWDVGFCTGSISIEARLSFPKLRVIAFEQREVCEDLIRQNACRHGALGIHTVMGDFMEQELSRLPRPEAVFIGGHGGRLEEMMSRINEVLMPHGRIVLNAVREESRRAFAESASRLGMRWNETHRLKVDEHNEITIMRAER